jgi:hypothetical protein
VSLVFKKGLFRPTQVGQVLRGVGIRVKEPLREGSVEAEDLKKELAKYAKTYYGQVPQNAPRSNPFPGAFTAGRAWRGLKKAGIVQFGSNDNDDDDKEEDEVRKNLRMALGGNPLDPGNRDDVMLYLSITIAEPDTPQRRSTAWLGTLQPSALDLGCVHLSVLC